MADSFVPTARTRITREPHRAVYDRAAAYAILDDGFVCHLGFAIDGQPFVIPTSYGRRGDDLYVHGSSASRMLRGLQAGLPACVTVTLVDGLVLARSIFNQSMNYRSVVVLGTAHALEDRAQKLAALEIVSEHILPGRWADVRRPSDIELKATTVMRLPIEEFSAKVRSGPPVDKEEDLGLDMWAGVVPLEMVASAPLPDERTSRDTPAPTYVRPYIRSGWRRDGAGSD
ncbi:MAG: pyridoxamine 5'-phosphate oxidase family protein [Candidatus Eremiobacter antarcticus]|nr:pyridoxamine 5'-phosphate oxidase family protein [Candidatus Eremiobacteraeota bacterium]MBC5807693.1 pyridoxamine 5'-phosphate oxidase family protein [Candidatus Eremiobacteraeota bacterium]PZR60486.1 MAG: pyridoxamine 5'-phosphate oxidase family protein [Candidatus Eremiobacter sp. RRmetagenome_bin22]